MTMAPPSAPSLLSTIVAATSILLSYNNHVTIASASPNSIQCASGGWFLGASPQHVTKSLQTIPPEKINDGYCDCPLDGLDEPDTGACSGSMDGMWAGIPPMFDTVASLSSEKGASATASTATTYFVCPQQPSLRLPLSRVNDGICDCCDGADEQPAASCTDICDFVLAKERAERAKALEDYEIGSRSRLESIAQYQKWREATKNQLENLKGGDLLMAEKEKASVEQSLYEGKVAWGEQWLQVVKEVVNAPELMEIIGKSDSNNSIMSAEDLVSFIISLCMLSGEISDKNVSNGMCVPLSRASMDLGIMWEDSSDDELPNIHYLSSRQDGSIVLADKIMLRLEGKDVSPSKKKDHKKSTSRRHPEDDTDDYYEDEYEDYLGSDDDYLGDDEDDVDYINGNVQKGDEEVKEQNDTTPTPDEAVVKMLLEKIRLAHSRNLFKKQAKTLLQFSLKAPKEDEAQDDGIEEDESSPSNDSSGVDPMALNMVKSTASKRMSAITRGEASAESAARFITSVAKNQSDNNKYVLDLQNILILTIYHSKVTMEDIAELFYTQSSNLSSDLPGMEDDNESSCAAAAPWSSMCPPSIVPLQGQKTFPPSFVVEAAKRRCQQRENSMEGVCATTDVLEESDFPSAIPDGYYNYYAPLARGPSDILTTFFARLDALHQIPPNLQDLKKKKEHVDNQRKSLQSKLKQLEKESGDSEKFGVDGELYSMRDTCHSVESGKYEYEVCIFGKSTQRDIGQKGGTHLGDWDAVYIDDKSGLQILKWNKGTKCWNGPQRSAEVEVTCGSETKLLTANEPDTCRYVFTMESPIACDEEFRLKSTL